MISIIIKILLISIPNKMPINQQEESKIIEKMSNRYTETFCSSGNICMWLTKMEIPSTSFLIRKRQIRHNEIIFHPPE